MRQNLALVASGLLALTLTATPVAAQDAPSGDSEGMSLMEQGARLFFRGLMSEVEPALKDLEALARDMGPALEDFSREMGPALRDLLTRVEDWSLYEAPEILPNGDIIIRRKPDAAPLPDAVPGDEIEL